MLSTTVVDCLLVVALGTGVGLTEILTRYRDQPWRVAGSPPALAYLAVNALAALGALALIRGLNWTFGVGQDAASQLRWTQVLVAGFGSAALFRTALFTVRQGNQEFSVGPSTLLTTLLKTVDRGIDRRRAKERLSIQLCNFSFQRDHQALTLYCLGAMQNLSTDEARGLGEQSQALQQRNDIDDKVKARLFSLDLMTLVGAATLKEAIRNLQTDDLGTVPEPVLEQRQEAIPSEVGTDPMPSEGGSIDPIRQVEQLTRAIAANGMAVQHYLDRAYFLEQVANQHPERVVDLGWTDPGLQKALAGGPGKKEYLTDRLISLAITDLTHALELQPRLAAAYVHRGRIRLRGQHNDSYWKGRSDDGAREDFAVALDCDPDQATRSAALFELGLYAMANKDYEAAFEHLWAAARCDERLGERTPDVYVALAYCEIARKNLQDALADLNEALELRTPARQRVLLTRAFVRRDLQDLEGANQDLFDANYERYDKDLPGRYMGGVNWMSTADDVFDSLLSGAFGSRPTKRPVTAAALEVKS
jgi:hypothetical protein